VVDVDWGTSDGGVVIEVEGTRAVVVVGACTWIEVVVVEVEGL